MTGQGQQGIYHKDQATEGLSPNWLCYQKTKRKQNRSKQTNNHKALDTM